MSFNRKTGSNAHVAATALLLIAGCGGGGGDGPAATSAATTSATSQGGSGGASTTTTGQGGHGGAGGASGVCSPKEFRCTGDVLEHCAEDGSGFVKVVTCPVAGLCDAAGGQCDACTPKERACSDGTTLKTCSDDGQTLAPTTCGGDKPFCAKTPAGAGCVQCTQAQDCTAQASECTLAQCGADGACGTQPIPVGTTCGAAGSGGACDGAGNCVYCKPGEVKCDGTTPSACDANGQWAAGPACSGATPICLSGACVACLADADCPTSGNDCQTPACSAQKTCGFAPKADGAPCSNGAGTCDGGGQCDLCPPGSKVCNGDQLLVCNAKGTYDPPIACGGNTPKCDPQSPKCVACYDAGQCPAGANECLSATCSASLCGYAPRAKGTACSNGGTCDGAGLCQVCAPNTKSCNGNQVLTCNGQGQYDAPVSCGGGMPYCNALAPSCVQCTNAAQCPASGNPCLSTTCAGDTCSFAPVAAGTACGNGGTCNGAGLCFVCQPGSKVCNGNQLLTCNQNGQYDVASCQGGTPVCNGANPACVQCTTAAQCPAGNNPCAVAACTNNVCGFTPKAAGTACNGGTCDGSGQCNACTPGTKICNGNSVLSCNAQGQYDAPLTCGGNTAYCDPANPGCYACVTAANCPASQGPCLVATCNGHVCGFANTANGTACSDGDACTQTDSCQNGACAGTNPKTCSALDQCHDAGVCSPATGTCSNPSKANGAACNDGNACTQTDSCQAGTCTGASPVVCGALDQCHTAGVCNAQTGTCTNPTKANGTVCNDGNACTQTDTCQAGSCTGASPKTCSALDQCHVAGTCDAGTGLCSDPSKSDGSACTLANATAACTAGSCGISSCSVAYGDCDGNGANGCETSLTSPSNCGSCGNACGAGQICPAGVCVSSTNLLAYYPFDEGVGTTIGDVSGHGFGGTTGAAWVNGKKGKALSFSGVVQAKVPVYAGLSFGAGNTDYTVEYYVYPTLNAPDYVAIFHKSDAAGSSAVRTPFQYMTGGTLYSSMGTSANANHFTTTSIALNTWTHVAVVHSGGNQLVYLNGVLKVTDALGAGTVGGTGIIFMGYDNSSTSFSGYLDDVRIYDAARSPAQIQADM